MIIFFKNFRIIADFKIWLVGVLFICYKVQKHIPNIYQFFPLCAEYDEKKALNKIAELKSAGSDSPMKKMFYGGMSKIAEQMNGNLSNGFGNKGNNDEYKTSTNKFCFVGLDSRKIMTLKI